MSDVLSDVLAALHLRGTVYCQSNIHHEQWALAFTAIDAAVFHVVRDGGCWLSTHAAQVQLGCGDLVVLTAGEYHVLSQPVSFQQMHTINLDDSRWQNTFSHHGSRDPQPHTSLICGTFRCDRSPMLTMQSHLPPLLHLSARQVSETGLAHTLAALMDEADAQRHGSSVMLHRLAEIMFIQIVRTWLTSAAPAHPGWFQALRDPFIAAALSAMHDQPQFPWTVEALARCAAMSRSAFAARFHALVGLSPITYLTNWRMQRAAAWLKHTDLSIAQAAQTVGYQSELAFAKAFKRAYGVTPAAYRRRATT
ncbi:MAG: AraC family transcriptional regulator [bacterium]|nr:AraC family transcriptional regulator [bacterium]